MADDLEAMKKRMKEMEEEAEKLKELQAQMERDMAMAVDSTGPTTAEADARSVYVGNVDYSCTPEDLQTHFEACGPVNRITILCDRHSGHPKGFAYIEFAEAGCVKNALALNESVLKGRVIKVVEKRTNVPWFAQRGGARGGRGRGGRFMRGRGMRGRGGNARGAPSFAPY
jgi:polyadenylate-binding protein 2